MEPATFLSDATTGALLPQAGVGAGGQPVQGDITSPPSGQEAASRRGTSSGPWLPEGRHPPAALVGAGGCTPASDDSGYPAGAEGVGQAEAEPSRRGFLGASLALLIGTAVGPDPLSATPPDPETAAGSTPASAPRRSTLRFFPGFEEFRVDTAGTEIHGVRGGSGPPLLLLHGYPQTHLEWHRIAAALAERFTVVATDLRGYGDSGTPPDGDDHEGYSKRAMAADQVEVMRHFGFERFALVGHDRGGRVAHRLALDHPNAVTRLAVLDIVPTRHVFAHVGRELATSYYHWFFMLRPAPFPETLYGSNADFVLRRGFFGGMIGRGISEEVYAEYLRCFADPATQHAMCEDYRAAAGIDLVHDEEDRNRKLACPTLVLWGTNGLVNRLYDVPAVWREYAAEVDARPLPGGHWLPEELPVETLAALLEFLRP